MFLQMLFRIREGSLTHMSTETVWGRAKPRESGLKLTMTCWARLVSGDWVSGALHYAKCSGILLCFPYLRQMLRLVQFLYLFEMCIRVRTPSSLADGTGPEPLGDDTTVFEI